MKSIYLRKIALLTAILLSFSAVAVAQKAPVKEQHLRAEMNFLASDALQGRGSGSAFEWIAGQYIASQLQEFGVEPAGETNAAGEKTYLQTVNIKRNTFAEAPKLTYIANGSTVTLENGREMLIMRMTAPAISGRLQKLNADDKPEAGAIVFVKLPESDDGQNRIQKLQAFLAGGAKAVIIEETPQYRAQWENTARRPISFTTINESAPANSNIIVVSRDAAKVLNQMANGTSIDIKGTLAPAQIQQTWNTIGKLPGRDSRLAPEVILLSAHMDHLGVRPTAPGDDKIFNGADDDASGCIAVLELARVLASGKRPKRTVYFAFFGSEEAGGYGAQFFVNNLPFPKENLIANLEFEMIGRPDAKVRPEELWLTGYERSNLGAELAKQGANLVADPHPEQNFFQRSDNYTLARQGIIAHTVSSFGLHTDYHKASDEIKTIDFNHMTRAINSMVKPVKWLVNSNFKPGWYEGKKP